MTKTTPGQPMRRTLVSATLLLLASIVLIAGIEHYDALHRERQLARDLSQQLEPFQRALQAGIDALIAENRRLAEQIAADPNLAEPALEAIAGEILAARYGGEEFALIAADTLPAAALRMA